jgi:hypothetical protein
MYRFIRFVSNFLNWRVINICLLISVFLTIYPLFLLYYFGISFPEFFSSGKYGIFGLIVFFIIIIIISVDFCSFNHFEFVFSTSNYIHGDLFENLFFFNMW